jgi:hypothetical protein
MVATCFSRPVSRGAIAAGEGPRRTAVLFGDDSAMGLEAMVVAVVSSSLLVAGLASVLAASVGWHWFWSVALVFGLLSPLLIIPAPEPWVALALQSAIVLTGIYRTRSRRSRLSQADAARWQFSLPNLLLATTVCCGLVAVAVTLPPANRWAWQSVAVIGGAAGCMVLGIWWWLVAYRGARWRSWFAIVVLGMLWGPLVFIGDWFVPSLFDGNWPPDPTSAAAVGRESLVRSLSAWVQVVAIVTGVGAGFIAGCAPSLPGDAVPRSPAGRREAWRVTVAVLLAAVVALPAVATLYKVTFREPIASVQVELPTPNGSDDFRAAGELLGDNLLINRGNFDSTTADLPTLRRAVAEVQSAVARARLGARRACWLDFRDVLADEEFDIINPTRSLARGMEATARLAMREERTDEATEVLLDLVDYGVKSCRGGLVLHSSVGIACTGAGQQTLYEYRDRLTVAQCHVAIDRMLAAVTQLEPLESFLKRDRVWEQHTYDWQGRLYIWLHAISGELSSWESFYERMFRQFDVRTRLLATELAITGFRQEFGRLPTGWDELVPRWLPEVPVDAFDAGGGPLRYQYKGDSYVLYSVGPDADDDGGVAPDDPAGNWYGEGDLRLDAIY